ncbi:GDP dissociation inhibitor [Fennellomyces sp. T-0311]|nr:GDP dissociation inhibitor [Fennellomyces sp. T-0311]
MSNENPQLLDETDFDVIVLGTGLIESVVAGSLARAGKKVLHLDSNDHYGSNWSVFGFKELLRWEQRLKQDRSSSENKASEIDYHKNYSSNYRNVTFKLYEQPSIDPPSSELDNSTELLEDAVREKLKSLLSIDNSADKVLIEGAIEKEAKALLEEREGASINLQPSLSRLNVLLSAMRASRSYNLDLTPKLLSCNGELVEILIRSGVGRYLEFKGVDDIGIYDNDEKRLDRVPSSKQDVFTNKAISLVDKRKLMRFLTFAIDFDANPEVLEGNENTPYLQFLDEKFKLSEKLRTAIIYAIAGVNGQTPAKVGLERTQAFVRSMGRFNKGGFLCPLYGGGSEIAQAFCRVCAVFGGVYILNQQLASFIVDESTGECKGIETTDGQKFNANWVVSAIDYLDKRWIPVQADFEEWISRTIVVTDKPLVSFGETDEMLCYSVLAPGSAAGNKVHPIYVLHQNNETMVCPRGEYVTYLWKESSKDDTSDLQTAIDLLLPEDGHIKFSLSYEQRSRQVTLDDKWKLPKNIIPCSDPTSSIDFEQAVAEATKIFFQCVPADTPFMPAQPEDPEDEY